MKDSNGRSYKSAFKGGDKDTYSDNGTSVVKKITGKGNSQRPRKTKSSI